MTLPTETSDGSGVVLEYKGQIACVTLTRRRMSRAMVEKLTAIPDQILATDARVVVVQSDGDDFCHGIDLTDPEILESVQTDRGHSVATLGGEMVHRWCTLQLPTVAILSNWTIGAGACLAFACDFRCAAPLTRISFPEVDRGMHLSWGILPRLIHECGPSITRRLAMLGDPVSVEDFHGDTFVIADDPTSVARELTERLASKPAEALGHIKSVIASSTATADQLDEDVRRFVDSVSSPGFAQAMAAWFSGKN